MGIHSHDIHFIFVLPNTTSQSSADPNVNDSALDNGESGSFSTRNEAASGGEEDHTILTEEMPTHTHTNSTTGAHTHDHGTGSLLTTGGTGAFRPFDDDSPSVAFHFKTSSNGYHTHTMGNAGTGTTHNTMHPFVVVNKIIKF